MSAGPIKVGVVGAGYWGPNIIRNCARLGILDSISDLDERALAALQSQYPQVSTLADFKELLRRPIDAVLIVTPAQLHASMALEALAAGKHIFVEKPLALSVQAATDVAHAARKAGRQVFVGHLLLYHPAIRKMRELISQGAIGDIWHVRSRRLGLGKLRAHENVWWSFAPHDVAVVLALLGSSPISAQAAQTSCRVPGISDVAYADFGFKNGQTAHVEVSWLDPQKSARLDVFGTSGLLTFEDSRAGGVLTLMRCGAVTPNGSSLETWRKDAEVIGIERREPLEAEIEAFVESVVTGQPAETDAEEGIAVLAALQLADKAAVVSHVQRPAMV